MSKLYKEIILATAVILSGLFCWWFLKFVFYVGNLTIGCWILGGILFILFGVALCLAMLLINTKEILFGSFILTVALFFIFFNNELFYYFIAILILILAFNIANKKIRKEEEVQVNLDFWRIWKRGLPCLITILCLIIALVYYFSPGLTNRRETRIKVPEKFIDAILKPIEGLIQKKFPIGIDLDSDVNKILLLDQRKELENKFGIKIETGDTGRKTLYKLIDYQLNDMTGVPYQYLIPLGLAVGLFITLKIISILYIAIVIMLSWLVLKILISLKFIKLEKIQKEVETVKL